MASIEILMSVASIGKSVAELTGLIDSLDSKVDRLSKSELQGGLNALRQAQHSTVERQSLLREARSRFNRATELETGYSKIVALVGLATTHHHLDDRENARDALEQVLHVNPLTKWQLAKAAAVDSTSPHLQDAYRRYRELAESPRERKSPEAWKNLLLSYSKAYLDTSFGGPVARLVGKAFQTSAAKEGYMTDLRAMAVDDSEEALAALEIQRQVSDLIEAPIVWLDRSS